jgi:ABC-type nitrate/sulfonate/bicarbonate transport system substrate-binding protein
VLPPINTEQAVRSGQIDAGGLSGVLQDHAIAAGGLRPLFSDYQIFGAYNGGEYVLRDDFIKKYPDTSRIFVSAVAKAIEWERTTPRSQVIAEFTKIIQTRHRNESTDTLQYWKSSGVASTGGLMSDGDFTRWIPWLQQTGVIKSDSLDASALNPYQGKASSPSTTAPAR